MTVAPTMSWVLACAWGALLATPVIRRARRVVAAERGVALAPSRPRRTRTFRPRARAISHGDHAVGRVLSALQQRRRRRRADEEVAKELPVAIDLLGVAVGAGCTPHLAVEAAARWLPAPIGPVFSEVVRSCSLGLGLGPALDAAATSTPRLRALADALLATDRLGVPVGPVLARLAQEERTALRRAAEAHARRIPVRLLFPLVFLVLPAFVLLTVVPGLAAGLGRL